jgi:hypothetical protein
MEIYAKKYGFITTLVYYHYFLFVQVYEKLYTFHSKITIPILPPS